jgi:hypothetical protein
MGCICVLAIPNTTGHAPKAGFSAAIAYRIDASANADNGSSNMSQLPARAFGQVAESRRKT